MINFDDVTEENIKEHNPKLVSKELRFFDYEKCVFDSTNTPITKKQVSSRNIKCLIYTITNNKITLQRFNDKEILYEDGITTDHSLRSNIPFINSFNDKDIPNSIEELKKIYKKLIEND